jgi:nitroreductase
MNEVKIAKTKYPVNELIRKRWSARSFSNRPIPQETLNQIFEAASWAPSSMNAQPWKYIYAHRTDKNAFQKMASCLTGGNDLWAPKASVLIVSLAQTRLDTGHLNAAAIHDVGGSNALLMIEAVANNVYGHLMGGFDREKAIKEFNLPDDLQPVVFIALGYLDDPHKLAEPFKTREVNARHRKSLDEFVFEGGIDLSY